MKKTRAALVVLALMTINTILYAQFGFHKPATTTAPTNVTTVVIPSGDLLTLVTLSTDQGMKAMDILASIFPPEKIAAFEEASKKYHELQAKRTDGNLDAEGYQASTDASVEFAKLMNDWSLYDKDKVKVVPQADHKLALMILVDGYAALQIPAAVQALESQVTSLASNPMQFRKMKQVKNTAVLFGMVGKQMPKQVELYKTTRATIKQIAAAENMTLPPDPSADSMKDSASATTAIHSLD